MHTRRSQSNDECRQITQNHFISAAPGAWASADAVSQLLGLGQPNQIRFALASGWRLIKWYHH